MFGFKGATQEDETPFRSLAEALPQIVWTANPDGGLDFTNRRWHEYSGLTPQQSQGQGWAEAVYPDDLAVSLPIWNHCLRTGETYVTEFRLRARDGSYRWHLTRALPALDERGSIVKWLGTCTDIDDQKRAEKLLEENVQMRTEELKKAHQELQQMAYLLSHEMQAPLLQMTSDLRMLKVRYGSRLGPDADAFMETATASATSVQNMLDGLWVLARIDGQEMAKTSCNCSEIFQKTVTHLDIFIKAKRAKVTEKGLPTINANMTHIEYMFQQLIENALKFSGDSTPEIECSASNLDKEWQFCVADNGKGFEMIDATRVFTMFQRLESDVPGIGMGLAVCKKIAEAHGGSMWATSVPGKGSCFYFTIAH